MGSGKRFRLVLRTISTSRREHRAREYWYFILFPGHRERRRFAVSTFAMSGPDGKFLLNAIFSLATFIPSLSALFVVFTILVAVAGICFWGSFPLVGVIILIYWACQPSNAAAERVRSSASLKRWGGEPESS
jgi:hypothetical protein